MKRGLNIAILWLSDACSEAEDNSRYKGVVVVMSMLSEYDTMWSWSVGCLDGVNRDISSMLKTKEVVFVLTLLYMCDEVVLWLFVLNML